MNNVNLQLKTTTKMKKLIAIVFFVTLTIGLALNSSAQTKTRPASSRAMSICGVAMGQSRSEFQAQLEASKSYEHLKAAFGTAAEVHVSTNYFSGRADDDIVWDAAICVSYKYNGFLGRPYNLFKTILTAKYGAFSSGKDYEGNNCLYWVTPQGQITLWANSSTGLVVYFVDNAALKKDKAELYNALP